MRCVALGLVVATTLFAQAGASKATSKTAPVTVPLVGCASDGQVGPIGAPTGGPVSVPLPAAIARQLAYYSAGGPGVLGPRGWHCFRVYGSSGDILFVAPESVEVNFSDKPMRDFTGPVIEVSYGEGGTSGMPLRVAPMIARVFPAYRKKVQELIEDFGLPVGPFPADELRYPSNSLVEFITKPGSMGLGTMGSITPNEQEIRGVAILVGPEPSLLHLSMRLPAKLPWQLADAIVKQLERDAPRWVE